QIYAAPRYLPSFPTRRSSDLSSTEAALREFQRNVGLTPDGSCGPQTLKMLSSVAPRASGGRPEDLRESEELHRAGPALPDVALEDRKSTRLNSSHVEISYAVF